METYEKKYKKALEWMREVYPTLQGAAKEDAEYYFPELAESKDERIRKALKEYFVNSFQNNGVAAICGVHIKDILAWLEKHGEQKPFDVEEVNFFDDFRKTDSEVEQKPAEWSEEDEKILSNIIKDLVHPWNEYIPDRIEDEIKWLKNKLKSLRPQSHWKPNDKQMELIKDIVFKDRQKITRKELAIFHSIYNDLKKLKE